MMQGQGGKRGPDRNPRKRKKETKAAKQRKAKNKKLHAQELLTELFAAANETAPAVAVCDPTPMPADPENSSAQDDVQIVGQTNVGASANALPAPRASERMVIVGRTIPPRSEGSGGARRAVGRRPTATAQNQVP